MKTGPLNKMKKTIIAGIGILGFGMILMPVGSGILNFKPPPGLQPAIASTQYGILGRQAPEIDLDTWIDGNGKPMAPLKLGKYRGKVIYLYFFQDW